MNNLERLQLEDASRNLQQSIEKCQILLRLNQVNVHYKDLNVMDIRLNAAGCCVSLAAIKRLLFEITAEASKKQTIMAELDHLLGAAQSIYDDPLIASARSGDCKRGVGCILRERGAVFFNQNDMIHAEEAWKASYKCFEHLGDTSAASEMIKKLEKLRHVNDVAAYSKQLVERTSENHERDALYKAFKKFDRDNSGEIDTAEFAALSVELGTFPALTPEEIKEAFAQLDTSANEKISFAEFWAWWCTDEIQAFANKLKAKAGRK